MPGDARRQSAGYRSLCRDLKGLKPNVSIIVPSRGRADRLAALLDCLRRQHGAAAGLFEVIVALDGADDGAPAACDREAPFPLRVLALDQVGISAAKNAAIAEARGDFLLFVNDDVEPAADFVQQHLVAQRSGHPIVLGASPFKSIANPTLFDECIAHTRMIFFYGGMQAGSSYGFRHAWNLNLSIDFGLLDRTTGPFADAFRPCMYEDLELAFRLMGSDNRVYYYAAARAVHNHRYTFGEYLVREVMLGIMAHELHRVNPACAVAVFGSPLAVLLPKAEAALQTDQADAAGALAALIELAERPFTPDCDAAMIDLFYRAHLPLKRRAFRRGLLAAADCPDITWQDRFNLARRAMMQDQVLSQTRHHPQEVPSCDTSAGVGATLPPNFSRTSCTPA